MAILPLPIELVLNVVTCCLPNNDEILIPSDPVTKTLVSFTLVCKETRRLANRYLRERCIYLDDDKRLSSLLLQVPTRPDLRKIEWVFLAPFNESIDDQPTSTWVRELLFYTSATLRRLVVDIPFRSLYPENDHLDVRRILREGFKRLECIEEFVSVQDELYLNEWPDTPVWANWPKLKRLALYNVMADDMFWESVAKSQQLDTVVLTRADSLRDANMKEEYRKHTARPLKVLIVNVQDDQVRFGNMIRFNWDIVDREKRMTIMLTNVEYSFEYTNMDVREACWKWIRIEAERGTLWSREGEVVQHLPRIAHPNVAELP
ncbi:hypothetical protein EJ04DRAFT_41508 [Polyplosphaeria fusca]|uniref:Uncharacterized protein n=1 Tax=Polyplosphaeria fusca TaxID=682080 RepID=A0A9P4R3D1_9PLEO|nr:hypothetical protein EJ04DRAFT_41508 [Polyplosphaeria fusca]